MPNQKTGLGLFRRKFLPKDGLNNKSKADSCGICRWDYLLGDNGLRWGARLRYCGVEPYRQPLYGDADAPHLFTVSLCSLPPHNDNFAVSRMLTIMIMATVSMSSECR